MACGVIPDHILADSRLGPGCKCVFTSLTVLAIEGRTTQAIAVIADSAGLPERTAREHLKTLQQLGMVHARATYAGAGRRGPNSYVIHGHCWEVDTYEELTNAENWGEPGWQKTGGLDIENPNDSEPAPNDSPTEIRRRKETIDQSLILEQKPISAPRQKTVGLQEHILALYGITLAMLPQPTLPLGKTTETALRARMKEHPELQWWQSYFARVAAAPWLTGQKAASDGATFRATLAWLLGPRNLDKVQAGNYDAAPQAPSAAARQTAKPANNESGWLLTPAQWAEHADLEAAWKAEHPAASERFLASRGSSPYLSELRTWRATGKRPSP